MHSAIASFILFNPLFRVWNFRLLCLATIAAIIFFAVTYNSYGFAEGTAAYSAFAIILSHHSILIFNWKIPGFAIADFMIVVFELGAMCYFAAVDWSNWSNGYPFIPEASSTTFVFVPLIVLLALSTIFRAATMIRSPTKFYCQRFEFLGGCQKVTPSYTPTSVLLNRSIARPLVNGESSIIILARAFIISCLALALPAAAIYYIIVLPLQTQTYTRELADIPLSGPGGAFDLPQDVTVAGGASVLMDSFVVNKTACGACVVDWSTVTGVMSGDELPRTSCNVQGLFIGTQALFDNTVRVVSCPYTWGSDEIILSVSLDVPPGMIVRMLPMQGQVNSTEMFEYIDSVRLIGDKWTPVLSGSRLFAQVTWTRRQLLAFKWGWIAIRWRIMYTSEVSAVQADLNASGGDGNLTSLTLWSRGASVARATQEIQDASPISGLSTFGGFWTFVNGVFAMFFGANVVYFLLGRRPLSALGLVHFFQKRTLVRRWHAEFPTLRTEGGLPGSRTAGIVAFIRQRLIDVDEVDAEPMTAGEDGRGSELDDVEKQMRADTPSMQLQQVRRTSRTPATSGPGGVEIDSGSESEDIDNLEKVSFINPASAGTPGETGTLLGAGGQHSRNSSAASV